MFRFKCSACNAWHEGMPSFGTLAPHYYHGVPEAERAARCVLNDDLCIVDDEYFFVRARLNIAVEGTEEPFSWGVWVSLSEKNFDEYVEHFEVRDRSRLGPYFGWLSTGLALYPDTVNLRTQAYLRNDGHRPLVVLEPTDHPLAIEQRDGISQTRLADIYAAMMHG